MRVEPNCVYVIPPSDYLDIREGFLHLSEPIKQAGIRMPIDFFFRALAEDRQERAICILFSGAGSDGTLGVRAVRGAGGLTIAQDPQTAQYGDMPRSAIATKLVDFILPPDQMSQTILEYLRHPYVRGGQHAAVLETQGKLGSFEDILASVQVQTGCDFRCYKKTTILRRIERRMGLRRIEDMAEYCKLLRRDTGEVSQLQKDLLINVTAFFRDPDAFEELRLKVIEPMIQARASDEALRVWVPGCSSGEEAYSLAMLLTEEMVAARKNYALQVFATDIDEEALEFGRRGIYPESIAADVGPERLARFFIRKEHGYQVCESLRNSVIFAQQNLISDPPFSKMDLVSCRNLLIYLDAQTQEQLAPVFNFALNSGGYLFLGKSEGVGGQSELFNVISKKARLYRRVTPARPVVLDTPILPGRKKAFPLDPPAIKPPAVLYADAIRQALLSHFAAGVVLVNRKGQILQFHGQTSKYLNMPTSEPNLNLLDIAKEGLSLRLRSALHKAGEDGKSVVLDQVPLTREEGAPYARVTVMPMTRRGSTLSTSSSQANPPHDVELLLAVIFEDIPRPAIASAQPARDGGDTTVRQLEEELRATQQDLQSSIEELQSANEELRVSNEEVVSTNEELQSTNEELETSKEELQSVNEELTTVNSQLQEKAERLAAANSDLSNLLKSTRIATLFLDGELRVKFFTPDTECVLKLIQSDIGRSITDLSTRLIEYDLTADARSVVRAGKVVERAVRRTDGSSYLVRVMPYLAQDGRADGVVVTFDNVTILRLAQERTRRLATVVTDSNDAVILFGIDGRIEAWNRGAAGMYGWSEQEALGMNIRDLAPAQEAAAFDDLIRRLLAGETNTSFETKRCAKDGRVLDVWLTITAVSDEVEKVAAIATTERDITERKMREEALRRIADETLRQSENEYRSLFENMLDGYAYCRMIYENGEPRDFVYLDVNSTFESLTGLKGVIGKKVSEVIPEIRESNPELIQTYGRVASTGNPEQLETYVEPLGIWFSISVYSPRKEHFVAVFDVITQRKRGEEDILRAKEEWERTFDSVPDLIAILDDQHRVVRANRAMAEKLGVTPEQCVGLPCYKAVHGTDEPPDFCPHTLTLSDHQPHTMEVHEERLGGDFLVTTTPMFGPDGRTTGTVHVARDITERKQMEDALKFLAQCGVAPGEDFFPSLARYLGQSLGMDFVCIDRLREGSLTAQTVAVYFDGQYEDNVSYALKDTPCGEVVEKKVCCFPRDVRHLFPKDQVLQDMKAESYVGIILWGSAGQPIGLIAVLSRKPLVNPELTTTILQLVAVRAAGELEREETEAALRQSEARFGGIVSSAMDAIVSIGTDQRILLFNAAAERMFGHRADEVVGRPMGVLIPPDQREVHEQDVREFAATGATARQMGALGELVGLRANGEQFPIEASISQIEVAGSKVLTVILRDISARKVAEETLARLAAIVESSNEAIISKNLEGIILTWNAGAERMLGYRAEEAVGQPITIILPPDRANEEDKVLQRQRRGEQVANLETVRVAKDGRRINVVMSSSPLMDPQGRVIGASKIIHDISDRKRAEESLARAAEDLERSNEDLAQFANIASHDLQEPLRMVSGFLKMLETRYKPQLDDKAGEYIGFAVEGATRMSHLISDLLEYSRVERRGQKFQPADARKALGAALANLQRSIKNAGATVTQDDLPTVQADPTQLMQLFQNLVGNAIKYRSQDRPCQVHVGVQKKDDQWVFSVRDNGIGIAPEQFDRIFVIFQRLHTRDKYPGTGIGLAICKKIVERHAGKIWVESKLGEGTTFYFTLPRENVG
jgi:two-component system CheB/CheR fusion protein